MIGPVKRHAAEDDRADRMQPELERRHHAEVAAAAAQCPKEVRVLAGARRADVSVGVHELGGDEVVARETVCAGEPAESAAEREACDARARDQTAGSRESEHLRLPVQLAPRDASLHVCRPADGIHVNAFHRGEVDNETALAHRAAGDVVAAPADSDRERVRAAVTHGSDHVLNAGATRDHRRPLVDHPVPNGPRSVVPLVTGSNELAAKCLLERRRGDRAGHLPVSSTRRAD